jgi:hypothetical protein
VLTPDEEAAAAAAEAAALDGGRPGRKEKKGKKGRRRRAGNDDDKGDSDSVSSFRTDDDDGGDAAPEVGGRGGGGAEGSSVEPHHGTFDALVQFRSYEGLLATLKGFGGNDLFYRDGNGVETRCPLTVEVELCEYFSAEGQVQGRGDSKGLRAHKYRTRHTRRTAAHAHKGFQ